MSFSFKRPSYHENEPYRVTMLVKGVIEPSNPPIAVLDRDGFFELIAGEELPKKIFDIECAARRVGKDLKAAVLLRTRGGNVKAGQPLITSIEHLNYAGFGPTALIDDNAESLGGDFVMACNQRVGRVDSRFMWHQAYLEDKKSISKGKNRLCKPRELFRGEMRAWLQNNVAPEQQHWVLERAENAFHDESNHLDDVNFTGEELRRAQILDQVVNTRKELGRVYAQIMQLERKDWPVQAKRFFRN